MADDVSRKSTLRSLCFGWDATSPGQIGWSAGAHRWACGYASRMDGRGMVRRLPLAGAADTGAVVGHTIAYALAAPGPGQRLALLLTSGHAYWSAAVAAAIVLGLASLGATLASHFRAGLRPGRHRAGEPFGRLGGRLALLQVGSTWFRSCWSGPQRGCRSTAGCCCRVSWSRSWSQSPWPPRWHGLGGWPRSPAGPYAAGSIPTSSTRRGSRSATSLKNAPARWPPMWAPCIIVLPLSADAFCDGQQAGRKGLAHALRYISLQRRRGTIGDSPAVVDHRDLAGQPVRLVQVLGGQQHGRPVGDQDLDQVPDVAARARFQPIGRLVQEEQHLRPADQAGGHV